jgi:hypothetical protein
MSCNARVRERWTLNSGTAPTATPCPLDARHGSQLLSELATPAHTCTPDATPLQGDGCRGDSDRPGVGTVGPALVSGSVVPRGVAGGQAIAGRGESEEAAFDVELDERLVFKVGPGLFQVMLDQKLLCECSSELDL